MKKILPPTHFYSYLLITVLFHYMAPVKQIINLPYNYAGILLMIAGIILNIQADRIFKKLKTTVKPDQKPTALIDYGPFRISRNPMYLGMTLFLLGTGILFGSVTAFAGTLFFIAAMEIYFIPDEEKTMFDTFGEEYINYKKKVRRWI